MRIPQEAILLIQQQEREDTSFSRTCLFCSHVFTGNRSVLFQHMLDTHSFNIGQPDNLGTIMGYSQTSKLRAPPSTGQLIYLFMLTLQKLWAVWWVWPITAYVCIDMDKFELQALTNPKVPR